MPVPNPVPQFTFFDESPSSKASPPPAPPTDLRWLRVEEYLRSRELAPSTCKAYERDLKQFLDWTDKPWHSITHRDLDHYKEELKQRRSPKGKPLSAATINRSLAALSSLFKWLTARDYITKDPMLLIEKPKQDAPQSKELSDEEVAALFEALQHRGEAEVTKSDLGTGEASLLASNDSTNKFGGFKPPLSLNGSSVRDQALLWVLAHGLRASEVSALNIEDYDGTRLKITEAKAGSVGTVPLLASARQSLDAYLGWRLHEGLPVEPESPLFLSLANNSWGERLSYWGIYKVIESLAELAGVKGCHPHRLRHTFATKLVLEGMDSMLARKLTRHKSESSFSRYTNRALELKAEKEFYERLEQEKSQ